MSQIMVYPPHGGAGELHSRPNAVDLVRHAGWSYDPPAGGTAPKPRSNKAKEEDAAKLSEAVAEKQAEQQTEAEEAAEEQRFSAGKVVDEVNRPLDESGNNGPDLGEEADGDQDADGEKSTDADTTSDDTPALTKADVEAMPQTKLRALAGKYGVTVDARWGRTKLIDNVWEAVNKAQSK